MRVSYVVFLAIFQVVQIKSDSSIDEYLKQTINNFRELMPIGDPDLHIPILDPYHIKDVASQTKNNRAEISLKLQNLILTGTSKFELKTLTVDMSKLIMKLDVELPQLVIRGNYDVNGKVMKFIPIYGKGEAVIGVKNFKINSIVEMNIDWNNGKLTFPSFDIKLDFSEAMLNLENILGGGSLGDLVNMLANSLVKPMFEKNKIAIETEIKTQVSKMLDKELKNIDIRRIINKVSRRKLNKNPILHVPNPVNQYVDLLIKNVKSYPEMEIDPWKTENQIHHFLGIKIDFKTVVIHGLKGITRVGNVLLNCDNKTLTCHVSGTLKAVNIEATFDTTMSLLFVYVSPDLEFSVKEIHIKFDITLNISEKSNDKAQLTSLEITKFDSPSVKVNYLGPIGSIITLNMRIFGIFIRGIIEEAVESILTESITKCLLKF